MRVEGKILRNQLDEYPLGTRFLCVGHWDESTYYRKGEVYTLICDKAEEETFRNLVLLHPGGGRLHSGNGYSGIWEVLNHHLDKTLEDYL